MSSDFFSDFSGGLEEGLGIAGKLQNISQSRQNFEMRRHSIEQQQEQIDDQLGLQEDVGMMLGSGKFDAKALYKKHPRAYKEIQQLQAEQQHLTKAKAAIPAAQIIQAIQGGDLNGAAQVINANAETIDKVLGYPGAHQSMLQQLQTNPQDVLERSKKAYVMASGDPKAAGMGNTFDPKAQAQIQKLDDSYSGKIDKLKSSTDASADAIQSIDTVIDNLHKAQKSGSLTDPALYRGLTQDVPGTDARDLREALSPSLAQGYINAITAAKATGGGGLRISQQEISVLSKNLGSLDIGQSNKQLSGNIKNLLTRLKTQRAKLVKHHLDSQTQLQGATQQYNAFQQQSGMGGDPILQDTTQPAQAPQAQSVATPPMQPQAQPQQPQMQPQTQAQPQAQPQAQGKQPTQDDLDYLQAHPETMERFVSYYGFKPQLGVKPQILR